MEWKTNYRMYVRDSSGVKCIGGKGTEEQARQFVARFCAESGCRPYALVPTSIENQMGRLSGGGKISLEVL